MDPTDIPPSAAPQPSVRLAGSLWLPVLMAAAALGGLAWSNFYGVPIAAWHFVATDAKTLYGSAWNLAHGREAYSLANLGEVFRANAVTAPPGWYGYAPVYPPPTLALLLPFTALGMVPAVAALLVLFCAAMASGVAGLLRSAARDFGLGLPSQAAILVVCAASPLLAFAIQQGNPTVPAAGLAILAFTARKRPSPWAAAIPLAAALLLKPHLALWLAAAMLTFPGHEGRRIVTRAAALVTALVAGVATVLAATGTLGLQLRSYAQILHLELASGASMNPAGRPVGPAQITSLRSLANLWSDNALTTACIAVLLVVFFALLLRASRQAATDPAQTLAATGWCAFGMLATYHRAYDAAVLVVVLPWLFARLKQGLASWDAWLIAAAYLAVIATPTLDQVKGLLPRIPAHSFSELLLYRQAALANLLLLGAVLLALRFRQRTTTTANTTHHGKHYLEQASPV